MRLRVYPHSPVRRPLRTWACPQAVVVSAVANAIAKGHSPPPLHVIMPHLFVEGSALPCSASEPHRDGSAMHWFVWFGVRTARHCHNQVVVDAFSKLGTGMAASGHVPKYLLSPQTSPALEPMDGTHTARTGVRTEWPIFLAFPQYYVKRRENK